ncbi:MAG: bifunctional 2-polyprenyl-6-hydroxyphenol methylase/3-demethylubiquinol 3-O-methyltransferase UbiG [Alphaproteobacteria bacterium]
MTEASAPRSRRGSDARTSTVRRGRRGASVDEREVAQFAARAEAWWDTGGPFRPLHALNPTRIAYVRDRVAAHFGRDRDDFEPLSGLSLLDVGCGGGLLAEPMTRLGARVVGIDAGEENVRAAAGHAAQAGLAIDYRGTTVEALASGGERFDVVLNMEVVEHVADRDAFLAACAELVAPGGAMVVATLNRTWKAYALAIVGAEYVLRWLPRGSHRWDRFVRPSELARALRDGGLEVRDITGLGYDLLTGGWRLGRDVGVNYMVFAVKG